MVNNVTAKTQKSRPAVVVGRAECRSLIEDVAFFRAACFRHVDPGNCREEDRRAAEAEIKAVLKKLRKRSP